MTEIRKSQVTKGDEVIDVIEIWQDQVDLGATSTTVRVLVAMIPVDSGEIISVVF